MFKSRVVVWSIIGTRISRMRWYSSGCRFKLFSNHGYRSTIGGVGRGRGETVPIETASNVLLLNLLAKWLVVLYCVHKHERHLFSRCCCLETLYRRSFFGFFGVLLLFFLFSIFIMEYWTSMEERRENSTRRVLVAGEMIIDLLASNASHNWI